MGGVGVGMSPGRLGGGGVGRGESGECGGGGGRVVTGWGDVGTVGGGGWGRKSRTIAGRGLRAKIPTRAHPEAQGACVKPVSSLTPLGCDPSLERPPLSGYPVFCSCADHNPLSSRDSPPPLSPPRPARTPGGARPSPGRGFRLAPADPVGRMQA